MVEKMEKKLYMLYDVYESKDFLGEFNTIAEVKKECKQRDVDTDSEWSPVLFKLDKETGKYKQFEDWSY
jgi:hypothetical protein